MPTVNNSKCLSFLCWSLLISLLPGLSPSCFAQCQDFEVDISYSPDPYCAGDVITFVADVTGGTPPFTYSWGAWPTGQPVWGTGSTLQVNADTISWFQLTVTDDNGCTASTHLKLNPPLFDPSLDQTDPGCAPDFAVTLFVTPQFPEYSYLWSTGDVTPFLVGYPGNSYSVTVTNWNGCTKVLESDVIPDGVPIDVDVTGPAFGCNNQPITLTATQNNNWIYQWSNGGGGQTITVDGPGLYSVTVTEVPSGCTDTDEILIDNANPPPPLLEYPPLLCPGGTADMTLSNSGDYTQFTWNTGESTPSITVTAGNAYSVVATDANGCTTTAQASVGTFTVTTPQFSNLDDICVGQETLDLNVLNSYAAYAWSTGATTSGISISSAGVFTVTVTDINGCTTIGSHIVEAAPLPQPLLPGAPPICEGSAQTLAVEGGSFNSYAWSTGGTTSSIQVSQAGTYSVTVTNDHNCSASTEVTVGTADSPVVSTQVQQSPCGNTANIQATGGDTYLWSTGETTPTITVAAEGNYSLTVTNAAGCEALANVAVDLVPPTPLQLQAPPASCLGDTVLLTASPGFASYLWSNGGTGPTIAIAQAGTYTVTATDAAGCTATVSQPASFNPLPSVTIAGTTSFCTGGNAGLSANGNYETIVWSNGATSANITTSLPGDYAVTVTSAAGCTATSSTTLTVGDQLVFEIAQSPLACNGTATLQAPNGLVNYLWSTGDTSTSISVSQAGQYSVTATDGSGCSGNATVTLDAAPLASVGITGPNATCQGSVAILSASDGFDSYAWSTGETSSSIQIAQSGSYAVTVINGQGCTATAQQSLVVHPNPLPSLQVDAQPCASLASLTANNGFLSYHWSNGATTPTISVAQTGNFTVTVSDANGCTGVATESIQLSTPPSASIIGNSTICTGGSSSFSVQGDFVAVQWNTGQTASTISVSQAGTYAVTVSNAAGCTATASQPLTVASSLSPQLSQIGGGCNGMAWLEVPAGFDSYLWSNGATTASISTAQAGTYSVTVSDLSGCTGTAATAVAFPGPPQAQLLGPGAICNGESAVLEVAGNYPVIAWNTGSLANSITVSQAGNYTVTVTDANGCTSTASTAVAILNPPLLQLQGPPAVCSGNSALLEIVGNYPGVAWNTGSLANSITVSQAGSYTVTVTDGNGCSASATFELEIHPLPEPQIVPSQMGCNGIGSLSVNGNYASYLWSDGATNAVLQITQPGQYSVTVTDGNGCTGTDALFATMPSPPQAAIFGAAQFCEGQATTLAAPINFEAYQWSTGETTQQITVASAGLYTLTITDGNDCTATASWSVSELPTIYTYLEDSSCNPQDTGTVILTLSSSATGCDSLVVLTTNFTPSVSGAVLLYACPGGYANYAGESIPAGSTQSFVFTNGQGCDSVMTVTVAAFPAVQLDWAASPSCWNAEDGELRLTASSGVPPYRFSLNGGNEQPNGQFQGLAGGNYLALVTDGNGCQTEVSALVPNTQPTVIEVEDAQIDCGTGTATLAPRVVSGEPSAIQWAWSNGEKTPQITVATPGAYSLVADDGCEVQAFELGVGLDGEWDREYFYVPNSFSPNGDGINDHFMAFVGQDVSVQSFDFKVFDRWGNAMFTTEDPSDIGWDGLHRTDPMQGAVFVWFLKSKVVGCSGATREIFLKGGVHLVK